MEDPRIISATNKNYSGGISDSNSYSTLWPAKLNPSHVGHHHPPSKLKGVMVQPNSHWEAQIYANNQRIWPGTTESESEPVIVYDSEAIKLKAGAPSYPRKFPLAHHTLWEPSFQSQLSTEAVPGKIRDGSYSTAKFADYARAHNKKALHNQAAALHCCPGGGGARLRQLFEKELTPSDVSKLNRLVIPKRYALRHFPRMQDKMGTDVRSGGDVEDMELIFFDRSMRSWKLRYCYWKSSQSFVFTKGWNSFAREKGLRPKDRVIFSLYESGAEKLHIIDVGYCEDGGEVSRGEAPEMKVVGIGGGSGEGMDLEVGFEQNVDEIGETKRNVIPSTSIDPGQSETKGFRLFGSQII